MLLDPIIILLPYVNSFFMLTGDNLLPIQPMYRFLFYLKKLKNTISFISYSLFMQVSKKMLAIWVKICLNGRDLKVFAWGGPDCLEKEKIYDS